MPYTDAGKNLMLDALRGTNPATPITHISLHTGDPTAGNEVAGGDPAYARQAVAFGAPAAGSMEDADDLTFNVPAGTAVTYVGFFSAATGGTLLAYKDITQESFGSQGTFVVTDSLLDLNA